MRMEEESSTSKSDDPTTAPSHVHRPAMTGGKLSVGWVDKPNSMPWPANRLTTSAGLCDAGC